jgi:hypothetical protein
VGSGATDHGDGSAGFGFWYSADTALTHGTSFLARKRRGGRFVVWLLLQAERSEQVATVNGSSSLWPKLDLPIDTLQRVWMMCNLPSPRRIDGLEGREQ